MNCKSHWKRPTCIWFHSASIQRKIRPRFYAVTRISCKQILKRWDFLTGTKSAIYKLSHDGFKLAVSDGSGEQGIPVHSTRMVLVDRHGDIRGYYDATEADAITKLVADTSHLLREQPQ